MKGRIVALCMVCVMLLSGCSTLLNRSYSQEKAHTQFSDVDKNPDILRAETYQGLVSALLFFISEAEENGVIRLYEYTGSAETDLDSACLEVTQQDPLGAYAVDYIKYDIARAMSYYEANVKIVYKRSFAQISDIVSVTGSSAIVGELREALADFEQEKVLRVSYFDPNMQAENVSAMLTEAYYDVPESAFGKPSVSVQLYPEQAVGQQRLVELVLQYPQDREELKQLQETLLEKSKRITKPLITMSASEKTERIVRMLKQSVQVVSDGEETQATAYAALLEGRTDQEGLALATELLFHQSGMQCRLVWGSRNNKPHVWNIVQIQGQWKHLDMTEENPKPQGDTAMQKAGYVWSGDIPVCQEIAIPSSWQ